MNIQEFNTIGSKLTKNWPRKWNDARLALIAEPVQQLDAEWFDSRVNLAIMHNDPDYPFVNAARTALVNREKEALIAAEEARNAKPLEKVLDELHATNLVDALDKFKEREREKEMPHE